jgi:hypothetical protein
MKATIEFNLPDDQHEFELMNEAPKMFCALIEIERMLRRWYKYETLNQSQYDIVEKIRDEFNDIIIQNQININK